MPFAQDQTKRTKERGESGRLETGESELRCKTKREGKRASWRNRNRKRQAWKARQAFCHTPRGKAKHQKKEERPLESGLGVGQNGQADFFFEIVFSSQPVSRLACSPPSSLSQLASFFSTAFYMEYEIDQILTECLYKGCDQQHDVSLCFQRTKKSKKKSSATSMWTRRGLERLITSSIM
jgi:hypothetical protein